MKRIITILLAITMAFTACFMSPVNTSASSKTWYNKILKSKKSKIKISGKTYNLKKYRYYKLLDINKDGRKELFLSTTKYDHISMDESVVLFSYSNGKIKKLKSFDGTAGGGWLIDNTSNKEITYYTRIADAAWVTSYNITNGKLKQSCYLHYFTNWTSTGHRYYEYFKNNKKCSEATYNKEMKKHGGNKDGFSYKKYR